MQSKNESRRDEFNASRIEESKLNMRAGARFALRSRGTRMLWVVLLALGCSCALACGPFFPNMMLVGGDEPVFTAPVARFYDEVARLKSRLRIAAPSHAVLETTNDESS